MLNGLEKKLYEIISEIDIDSDKQKVSEAYIFAKKCHEGQKRKSGREYITHPLSVAISLWEKFKNVDLLISGLLHDTVEDCIDITMKEIYEKFGDNVGYIVDSVTKTENTFYLEGKEFTNIREKILHGGMKNIGCLLVKLGDREHNLATLSYMPKNKQIKKSFESQALYLPLIKLLNFKNNDNSIEKAEIKLQKYLEIKKIDTAKEFKNDLLNTCFHNFSEEIFDTVYNNSDSVVWEIADKKVFESLVESGWFDSDSVEVKKIESDGKSFKAYFVFTSGSTFDFTSCKISVSSSRFIS